MDKATLQEITNKLGSRKTRLNTLYKITNEKGEEVTFVPNDVQQDLLDNLWYKNIILKSRQHGVSTLLTILFLDTALFNENKALGIIADTLGNAKNFLRDKIKFAYDRLPEAIRNEIKIEKYSEGSDNAGIWFSNGSRITVGTSFRSGTLQYLHISEYGKICATNPIKAREIKTGALNTVHEGQFIFIESTAEGEEGDFYDKSRQSEDLILRGEKLTKLDYRFHFYPWYQDKKNQTEVTIKRYSDKMEIYFQELRTYDIHLTEEQKNWYVKKWEELGEDMYQEHPSLAKEAFKYSNEGKYYHDQFIELESNNQICNFNYERGLPVDTYWDLGINDSMSIWFIQKHGIEYRVIDFIEGSGEGLGFYIDELANKGYRYGRHVAPHDIQVRELSTGNSRWEEARRKGIHFEIAPQLDFNDGINAVRKILSKCWFNEIPCKEGVRHLKLYKKKWSEQLGKFTGALHDSHSHAADAFRYFAISQREQLASDSIRPVNDEDYYPFRI